MLKAMEKQKPGEHWREKRSDNTTVTPSLKSYGISKDQSSQWQKLAAVPELDDDRAWRP